MLHLPSSRGKHIEAMESRALTSMRWKPYGPRSVDSKSSRILWNAQHDCPEWGNKKFCSPDMTNIPRLVVL